MKIIIQPVEIDASNHLTEFIKRNLDKLDKTYSPILEAQVYLKKARGEDGKSRICEIKLVIPGDDLFASKEGETLEIAVHNTFDAIKHQVERLRTKRNDRSVGAS